MTKRLRINRRILARLERALKGAEALADVDGDGCAVAREAKAEARIYVTTWIIPQLRQAIDLISNPEVTE
jgi:hypothetical protein